MVTICPLKYSYLTYIYNTGRNDPGPKRLTAESTHQSRPNRPGRNDSRPKRPGFPTKFVIQTLGPSETVAMSIVTDRRPCQ